MKQRTRRAAAVLLVMLVMLLPMSAFAAECLMVKSTAPATGEVTAGGLFELPLADVFTDSAGHSVSYAFETSVTNEHTKIKDGSFYFSAFEAGDYPVTLTATCDGGSATHTLTVTVNAAQSGNDAQYNYDETAADSVKVWVTLSNDGYPLISADETTVLSHLQVEVPYFDLGDYGLSEYYRYETEGGRGAYINTTLVERPTLLHLYIYLLERYYMGLPEELCGNGSSGVLEYADEVEVKYMDSVSAYTSRTNTGVNSALYLSGNACSMYMENFWGHDENLMYYRNHCYPYMSDGIGATADYILLSDDDVIDLAMFTNWNFYSSGGYFASFDKDQYRVDSGKELTVKTLGWSTDYAVTGMTPRNGLTVALYDSTWKFVDAYDYDGESNSITFTAPVKAGTYYLLAMDPNATDGDEAKIAPATARVVVKGAAAAVAYGDLNNDGKVTAVDAAMTYAIANARYTPSDAQKKAADVSGDGKVTAVDAAMVYAYANARLTKFPADK